MAEERVDATLEEEITEKPIGGGSWSTPGPAHTATRGCDEPTNTNGYLGFRCVRSLTS